VLESIAAVRTQRAVSTVFWRTLRRCERRTFKQGVRLSNHVGTACIVAAHCITALHTHSLQLPKHSTSIGFNIVWSVLYEHREYNHSRLFLNLLVSWRPTFRLSASWPQPQTSVGRRCQRAKVTVHACGLYRRCELPVVFVPKSRGNHGIICVILAVLTCLPLIKIFCISSSKLLGRLFTIFTPSVYIVSVFLACFYNGRACDRFSAWSCSLKHAVYNTPDSQCLDSGVLYIPFIHSRTQCKR